jgi:hypothetical protein
VRARTIVAAAAVVLLVAIASGAALYRHRADPATGVTVTWGGSEGHPCCVYDAQAKTVDVTLAVDGTVTRAETVTATVTAYADENTSQPVGSTTRTVQVTGTVHRTLHLTIPVERKPHVDDDGIVACRLSVQH